ncbi:MAG: GNAT family N-acetyltransferase [Oculatellaceae cyanobacterium Prado106]|jgi:N-acetylglutamate synthase-like GNAT family acetyltransferase|nr:GNAT family N-acetyltransferase [Oculatellaceae cyanobacterium Prado106]
MLTSVTVWYLEMLRPEQLQPTQSTHPDFKIAQAIVPSPEFSRFLYTSVGGDWYWLDRLSWTRDRWLTYLDRPQVQTWVAYLSGTPIGYVELEAQPDRQVEIAYFGLQKGFTGQRFGGHLLSVGIEKAWAMDTQRVWVHTCSLDGPYALKNYQSRGFQLYDQTQHSVSLPSQPIDPWEGAYR